MAETKTLGQLVDFHGLPTPEMEPGDVITELFVVAIVAGEAGETISLITSPHANQIKVSGMLRVASYMDKASWGRVLRDDEEESP